MRALDLFAGCGGWDVAARDLGIEADGVEIMPEAVQTRIVNGLKTHPEPDVWDVAQRLVEGPFPDYDGLIASPPCPTFSMAGQGSGRRQLDLVLKAIADGLHEDATLLREWADTLEDARTGLTLTPLLFWRRMRPRWVAFEQVPTVLPVWEAMADVMREAGYSVWTGNLHAEQYGVPQTRKRAILMARRNVHEIPWAVWRPDPTHSRYYPRDKKRLDPGVEKWVSMAEALGWTPPGLVYAGAGETAIDTAGQIRRNPDEPAHTTTTKGTAAWVQDRQLGAGRLERHGKPRDHTTDDPSYSMRGQASGSAPGGGYVLRNNNTANAAERQLDQPAPTLYYGQRSNYCAWETPDEPTSRRVTVREAATLQGFPPDFEFCGTKTKQYLQVGNAICPPLALHILSTLTGIPMPGGGKDV